MFAVGSHFQTDNHDDGSTCLSLNLAQIRKLVMLRQKLGHLGQILQRITKRDLTESGWERERGERELMSERRESFKEGRERDGELQGRELASEKWRVGGGEWMGERVRGRGEVTVRGRRGRESKEERERVRGRKDRRQWEGDGERE